MFTRMPSALLAQAVCAGALATVVAGATPASAQTTVPCSATALSAAITAANVSGGTLVLSPGCTYALTTPLPAITNTVTINARHSTITRTSAAGFSILTVAFGGNLSLLDATITNGDAPDFGGGIANHGALTVTGSAIVGNHGNFSGGIGGGTGSVTHVVKSSVMDNTANNNGGGLANDGQMTIEDSRIIDNTAVNGVGGAVANDGILVVSSSNLNENSAHRGGGVANVGGGLTTLNSSNVNNNTADVQPGGILNTGGTVTLNASRVKGNDPTNCTGSPVAVPGCTN
ncbi:hypothetical protein [Yinghuangia seranimata]|uniref:hypothetical protein n=1 Tax=Yinghuangia seranimata TaxID=408067 RepID=UPI00248C53C8|nr:hypothetical protein [Yinghuangia seranimata]MDI2131149.1 hypothetical protein [Yinghuangia seranimata]